MWPHGAKVYPTRSLNRIGMKNCTFCASANGMRYQFQIIDCASLIVDSHHRHNGHVARVRQLFAQHIGVHWTLGSNGNNNTIYVFDAMQHSMMFCCCTYCATARTPNSAQHCRVGTFSSATGEDNFAGSTPNGRSDNIACFVYSATCLTRELV
jgi:hypothetical protein